MGASFSVGSVADLKTALKAAQGGDTIQLAAGDYGDVSLNGLSFASDVVITSANPDNPAVFHSLTISSSTHLLVKGVDVDFTPTATSYLWSPAVTVAGSSYVSLINDVIVGGNAINGVAQTAMALDPTNNVIGLPTGYGLNVAASSHVTVQGVSISNVARGVVLNNASYVDLNGDAITNVRMSMIDAVDISNTTIRNNDLSSSHPWRWGQTPIGDHGDFIHIWNDTGVATPSAGIQITNNYIHQGNGTAILGILVEDRNGLGYTGATISGNVIVNENFQGIALGNTSNSTITGNTLLQPGGLYNAAPSILLRSGGGGNVITGNVTGGVNKIDGVVDEPGAIASTISGNRVVQTQNPGAAGYYSASAVAQLSGGAAAVSSQLAALGLLAGSGAAAAAASVFKGTAAVVATHLDSLNIDAAVTSIVVTDNASLPISVAQWRNDAHALAELANADGAPVFLTIRDTVANIASALGGLTAASSSLASVVLTDAASLTLTAGQAVQDAALLGKLYASGGSAAVINVSDTAANISSLIDALGSVPHLGKLVVSDANDVTVNVSLLLHDQALVGQNLHLKVVDTAANITMGLSPLNADARVVSIVIADDMPIMLTTNQKLIDAKAVSELVNADGSAAHIDIIGSGAAGGSGTGTVTGGGGGSAGHGHFF